MLQPLFKSMNKYPGTYEIGNIMILDGLKYDSDTLAPLGLLNISQVRYPGSVSTRASCTDNGGQISIPHPIQGYGTLSTAMTLPNMFRTNEAKIQVSPEPGYTIVPTRNSETFMLLYDDKGDEVKALASTSGAVYQNASLVEVGTNEWLATYVYKGNSYVAHRIRYNPDTRTFTTIHSAKFIISSNKSGQYLFKSSDNTKFFYYTGYNGGYARFTVYNNGTQSITHIGTSKTPWNANYIPLPSPILPEDVNSDIKRMYIVRPTAQDTCRIELVSVDTLNSTVNYTQCNVDSTGANYYFSFKSRGHYTVPFIHESNGVRYLSFYVSSAYSGLYSNSTFKVYTYEIDANDPTILRFVTQFDFNEPVYGYMPLDSSYNKILLPTISDTVTMSFVNGQWSKINFGLGRPTALILDTKGRLWLIDDGNQYYLIVPQTPTQVQFRFEKQTYEYTGSPITTFINVGTFNYLGERIATSGTLKIISNNAEFLDGSKATAIKTNTTADTQVDFKITGAGVVRFVYDINLA